MFRMYIIATFEQSSYLELALVDLEKKGVQKNRILAVPLDQVVEERKVLDTIHRADGFSLFDGAAVLGTVFMVLGVIYGFVLEWGPVIWGLIGLFTGALLGFVLDFFTGRDPRKKRRVKKRAAEVVLIINCDIDKVEVAERVLREHLALGIGRFPAEGKINCGVK